MMKKFGPAQKPTGQLRLVTVKIGFTQSEAAQFDARRGHYSRAEFARAATLGSQLLAAPLPAAVATWSDSARIQSCLAQINGHAAALNSLNLDQGEQAVARQVLAESAQILASFKEFRLAILTGEH